MDGASRALFFASSISFIHPFPPPSRCFATWCYLQRSFQASRMLTQRADVVPMGTQLTASMACHLCIGSCEISTASNFELFSILRGKRRKGSFADQDWECRTGVAGKYPIIYYYYHYCHYLVIICFYFNLFYSPLDYSFWVILFFYSSMRGWYK